MFASMFFCLISSAISRWASASNGLACSIRSRFCCFSIRSAICLRSSVANVSRLPDSSASASRGLFCFNRASWSGLERNISRTTAGSSSMPTDGEGRGFNRLLLLLLLSEPVPPPPPPPLPPALRLAGTWMELKSRFASRGWSAPLGAGGRAGRGFVLCSHTRSPSLTP
uniref:Putative secreted protein n=1 Tax=Anopheles darlingi TaxID=43151 RepID=A0A2M4DIW1_ANODA